ILMDSTLKFTAVVEYYELDKNEYFDINKVQSDILASIIVAHKLKLPLFVITYEFGKNDFIIYDYFNKKNFTKSLINPTPVDCEFLQWWKTYKGTQQYKPFYN